MNGLLMILQQKMQGEQYSNDYEGIIFAQGTQNLRTDPDHNLNETKW